MDSINEITDGITSGVEARKMRGMEIAALARIDKVDGFYVVPSVTNPRPTKYKVQYGKKPTCTCADFETRGCKCKHVYAVEYFIKRETTQHVDGSTTVTESVTIKKTRKTYPQDWPNYNAAQVNEQEHFRELLHDLCEGIEEPPTDGKPRRGRPPIPLKDVVFSMVSKVYGTRSGRRSSCDIAESKEKGFIDHTPHYNTCFRCIENPAMFPILLSLIERAALPLATVESEFAVDSTGFAYSRFVRWFDIKYNRFTAEQQWVKAHIACGVKTNVVTAIEIHDRDTNDCPQLPSLVNKTAENFTVKEVSADKGYSSRENHVAVRAIGADPYIMFKANTTGGVGGIFKKMYHFFQFKREEFLGHYHKRSNIESTVMMIKTKFGDAVRSKSEVAAKNEVLCKVLCHNICCLISAMYELNLEPMLTGPVAPKIGSLPQNSLFSGN